MKDSSLITLDGERIRKVWEDGQWYFSIVDVIEILTDSSNPSVYWSALKKREIQSFTFCKRLNFARKNGKKYPSDAANTEGVLRIVMSVPSPKAEPLKLWLAEQGKRTIDETENPELLTQRQAELYKAKGYSDEWIQRRLQTIDIRKELTEEWQKRGVKEGTEYAILTATIAKGTFGVTPSEHTKLKGLNKENLRDHMTPLELILTALGEEVTRTLTVEEDAQGFEENHEAAQRGGKVASKARLNVEKETGKAVVSSKNYLKQISDAEANKQISDDSE
jgi:DNA-damage-inducible protein D